MDNPARGESDRYDAAVKVLREKGCTCPLRWNGKKVIPVNGCKRSGDLLTCDAEAENP